MKKIIILSLLIITITSTCFAFRNAYEPESDTAVSFSTMSVENGCDEFTFVNYATVNGNNEYWLRFSSRNHEDKILHYATLIIDDTEYKLLADNPTAKYQYAGQSLIDNSQSYNLFGYTQVVRYDFRYFPLSTEIVEKLKTAKNVSYLYHTAKRINIAGNLNDKFVYDINKTLAYKYVDFKELWNPKDLKGNLKK